MGGDSQFLEIIESEGAMIKRAMIYNDTSNQN